MDLTTIGSLIGTIGFPIVCALGMAWFIYKIYLNTTKENQENMKQVQARCLAREEKLYNEIEKNRKINEKAIETIAHYAEKLDIIQKDIGEIKNDIVVITTKMEG